MKLLVVVAAIACLGVTSADLLATLKQIHSSPAFHHLPQKEQLLVIELVGEIEAGQLKEYIDHIGYHHVLQLLDHLPAAESQRLNHMLHQELQKEGATMPTDAPVSVGRRLALPDQFRSLLQNAGFQRLTADDQELVKHLLNAASVCTLSTFIGRLGYPEVIRLMEKLPNHEAHTLNHFIVQHMSQEKAGSRCGQ